MIRACKHHFKHDTGSIEELLIQGMLTRPWEWHGQSNDHRYRSKFVMPLSETGLKVGKFMEGLHTGNWDAIIVEVVKYTPNWNLFSHMEKLRHEQQSAAHIA